MLTANHMTCPMPKDYHKQLSPEFNKYEPRNGIIGMLSWGAIDAPNTMPAGSTYPYETTDYVEPLSSCFSRL